MFARRSRHTKKIMTAMALFYSSAFCKNICGLLVLAEEALHPLKLSLSNFNQDIKAFTNYCQLHLHNIIGSGGQISHTHWIRIQESLEEAYTEKFWLQMMDWSKNWRKQTGEGHDWTMMQYLAKVDLEYSRLLNLNQWKMNDPNSTIVALHAEIADLKVALQATKPLPPSGQQKQKPTWVPKEGQPLEVTHNNKLWKYCGRCKCWNQTHTTPEHKPKSSDSKSAEASAVKVGPAANLASGSPSSGDLSQPPPAPEPSTGQGSFLNLDF